MANPAKSYYGCLPGAVINGGRTSVAATAITLTDTAHPRLYQRTGVVKSVAVSGTSNGTRIQARVCPPGKGLTQDEGLYPFANLTSSHAGGAFSLPLVVPQGDGWVVQVRDGVNHTIGSTGTHSFGVGAFIALIGQSNMQNMFENITDYPLGAPGTYSTRTGITRLGNIDPAFPAGTHASVYGPSNNYYHETGAKYGDGLIYAANRMRSALGCPIAIMDWAESGTWINLWVPGGSMNDYFLGGISAVGGDFEAALWLHGETDAQAGTSGTIYKSSLQSLYNQLRALTGRSNLDFGVVIVGPATTGWATEGLMAPIRKAQLDFVSENIATGAFVAGTDIDGDLGAGTVHINQSCLIRQGYRYGEGIYRRLSRSAYSIEGPKISSASRSGSVVTVSVTQQGGSSLLDGAGGLGGSLLGFRVFDASTPMTISSTAISGNTITLTLSATPSGVVTMDYAMANAPFGASPAMSSLCYDNQTIPGTSVGLPLQPKPLITVS